MNLLASFQLLAEYGASVSNFELFHDRLAVEEDR
jgi:hypothetical protein